MPELPEVETIRRGLESVLADEKIEKVEVLEAKCFIGEVGGVIGAKITSLDRRGKALIINLNNGKSLLIHLRMTGQLIFRTFQKRPDSDGVGSARRHGGAAPRSQAAAFRDASLDRILESSVAGGHPNKSFTGELPDKSTRVIFTLENGKLFFNDQRKFGFVKVLPTAELDNEPFLAKLGREPWQETAENFEKTLARHSSSIKSVILDQQNIAGVGNIYADEGLFRAKVHPARAANSLTKAEAEKLLQALRDVMTKSIESGGSSLKNYVKADGTRGDYLDNFAQVFNRTGQPCPVCGGKIEKTRVAGRGTHFCPRCQKAPDAKARGKK
jgi:formamidopyrimidine-DNA glycosylase